MGIYNSMDGTCTPLPPWARRSGPRKTIYYDPRRVRKRETDLDLGLSSCGIICVFFVCAWAGPNGHWVNEV